MRIAHIVLPGATEYERKSQRADREALETSHEVVELTAQDATRGAADVAHVYASSTLSADAMRGLTIPFVASADAPHARWFRRAVPAPAYVLSPVAAATPGGRQQVLPEAVETRYFDAPAPPRPDGNRETWIVGSYARPSASNFVEQTLARIHRFRPDVTWNLYRNPPAPHDLAGVDLWVDPAVSEMDFDGFAAEALVVGRPVVASRTPINVLRLEQGRTGALVPPGDPNELTHAILTALFKREVAESRQFAARQTAAKFRARQRLRLLLRMYETLIP